MHRLFQSKPKLEFITDIRCVEIDYSIDGRTTYLQYNVYRRKEMPVYKEKRDRYVVGEISDDYFNVIEVKHDKENKSNWRCVGCFFAGILVVTLISLLTG